MSLITEVTSELWRGPQPTIELWSELQDLGVKQTVKLNYPSEASDMPDAGKFGILVREFPMPPSGLHDAMEQPKDDLVMSALDAMDDGPTYVHCTHGHDRTGLLVGLYRLRCGWTVEAAYAEMRAMGFHRLLHGLMEVWERLSRARDTTLDG